MFSYNKYFRFIIPILILTHSNNGFSVSNEYIIESLSSEEVINFSLKLPDLSKVQYLTTRGSNWGLKSQVENPRCNDTLMLSTKDGKYLVPAHCTNVTWQVKPLSLTKGSIDASDQLTVFINNNLKNKDKLILLSEPTSLLRPIDDGQAILISKNTIQLRGAQTLESKQWIIPDFNNAPEFYLIGNSNILHEHINNLEINYFCDIPQLVKEYGLIKYHKKALTYLVEKVLFDSYPQLSNKKSSLLIIFIGSDEKYNYIGGAAGNRSFVANYLYGNSDKVKKNNAMSQVVIAHEQFHQLLDMIRGVDIPSQPVWIEEAMAQYFSLKTLVNTENDKEIVLQIHDEFIQPNKKINDSLMTLEAKFKQGDYSVYPLFYSQGATFLSELDKLLIQYSEDKKGIEPWLGLLINSEPDVQGGLPIKFKNKMINIGGEPIAKLITDYVG